MQIRICQTHICRYHMWRPGAKVSKNSKNVQVYKAEDNGLKMKYIDWDPKDIICITNLFSLFLYRVYLDEKQQE